MDLFVPHSCPSVGAGAFEQQFPIGMGYIPWQTWSRTYPQEQALMRGTIWIFRLNTGGAVDESE